nr:unnamed protein product [Callosobruchus chinensis]
MENGFPMVSQKTELLPGSEKACQHAKQEKERRKHAVGIVAMESIFGVMELDSNEIYTVGMMTFIGSSETDIQ